LRENHSEASGKIWSGAPGSRHKQSRARSQARHAEEGGRRIDYDKLRKEGYSERLLTKLQQA